MAHKKRLRPDNVLSGDNAQKIAEEAALAVGGSARVGEHLSFTLDDERLGTHSFTCTDPGYRGWYWAVVLARVPRGRIPTVCEVTLLPGEDALLAPRWVPWAERLRPSDVGPTDTLPYIADDERLVQQYEAQDGDEADQLEIDEMGLGRTRVLSREGLRQATERWYAGDHGPHTPAARRATEECRSCGFLIKLAGSARTMFGVCANEWSVDDGRVVSFDHGCGAHSETDISHPSHEWEQSEPVIDELDLEIIQA
ncbi:MAG: DUF3027 domain-containing protein [Bowdeniella nasicola]|nr:DUF3027 domain-containing protein [Bowdeniella nasicola]